jgi:hypothetical protein
LRERRIEEAAGRLRRGLFISSAFSKSGCQFLFLNPIPRAEGQIKAKDHRFRLDFIRLKTPASRPFALLPARALLLSWGKCLPRRPPAVVKTAE